MQNLQTALNFIQQHGITTLTTVTARDLYAGDTDAACALLFALLVHYDIFLGRRDTTQYSSDGSAAATDLLLRWIHSLSSQPPLAKVCRCEQEYRLKERRSLARLIEPLSTLFPSFQLHDFLRDWRSGEVLYALVRNFVGWILPKQLPEQV